MKKNEKRPSAFRTWLTSSSKTRRQLQVYRLGSIDMDAYIVGVTDGGGLAGLSTKLVETRLQQAFASYECSFSRG
ncbi:nuclease A inhibitor family protein [Microcoleus sp. AR_TQ3_B6]|uniref:nuclease A inhibitor family protein n=1 Tax=Microcoleus sp. AR_TQ3_B6 TaxID=3055284 RepID=UPI00403F1A13